MSQWTALLGEPKLSYRPTALEINQGKEVSMQ
jgi:hypothetical protein